MLKSILKGLYDRFCKPESSVEMPSPGAQSSVDKSRWVFEAHLQEYQKLRDEIVFRLGIQKSCIQYALTLTAAVAAFVGAMYKGFQSSDDFLWLVLIAAFINGLLLEFLIAYLLFQLYMVCRIHIYLDWVAAAALPAIMKPSNTDSIFRWDRSTKEDPWTKFFTSTFSFAQRWYQSVVLPALVVFLWLGLFILYVIDYDASHQTARVRTNAVFLIILVLLAMFLWRTFRNIDRGVQEAKRNVAGFKS